MLSPDKSVVNNVAEDEESYIPNDDVNGSHPSDAVPLYISFLSVVVAATDEILSIRD